MTLNEFYTTVGGNYEDVIARLHSEAFTEKFLRMIPQDNSLPLLKEAAAAGDVPTAFRAVHTLKGIALNLGLTGAAGIPSRNRPMSCSGQWTGNTKKCVIH